MCKVLRIVSIQSIFSITGVYDVKSEVSLQSYWNYQVSIDIRVRYRVRYITIRNMGLKSWGSNMAEDTVFKCAEKI